MEDCTRDCFNNAGGNGIPRNWTDLTGGCCRYYFLGNKEPESPAGQNHGNSNSGANAAIRFCVRAGAACSVASPERPRYGLRPR